MSLLGAIAYRDDPFDHRVLRERAVKAAAQESAGTGDQHDFRVCALRCRRCRRARCSAIRRIHPTSLAVSETTTLWRLRPVTAFYGGLMTAL